MRLTIDLARLIAAEGTVTQDALVDRTLTLIPAAVNSARRPSGESIGSQAQALTRKAMLPLERAGIVRRDGEVWSVADVDELARVLGMEAAR